MNAQFLIAAFAFVSVFGVANACDKHGKSGHKHEKVETKVEKEEVEK